MERRGNGEEKVREGRKERKEGTKERRGNEDEINKREWITKE